MKATKVNPRLRLESWRGYLCIRDGVHMRRDATNVMTSEIESPK